LSAFFRRFSNGAPLLGLLIVFAIDRVTYSFFGDITLSPLLCVLTLAVFPFFLSPRNILLWSLMYALLAFSLLTVWRHSFVLGPSSILVLDPVYPLSRAVIRSITVLFVGFLCSLLSKNREQIQKSLDGSIAVMSALPLGVLISDRSGRISFVNQKARLLLGDSLSNITGSSFFSLFSNPEGNLIEKYSMLAEVSGQSLGPLILRLRSDPHRSFSISLFSLQAPSELLVATLLTDCPAA